MFGRFGLTCDMLLLASSGKKNARSRLHRASIEARLGEGITPR